MILRRIRCYAVAAAVFLALDAAWLALIGPAYRQAMGDLLRPTPLWPAAIAFYLVFVLGVLVFAVIPARSAGHAASLGASLGGLCYATFELTNLALITGWPAWMAPADILWGATAGGAVAVVSYWVR